MIDATEDKINLALVQLAVLLQHGPYGCHVDCDAGVLPTEPAEHCRDQPGNEVLVAGDPHFADGGIGQEFDALHALAQLIEHSRATAEQGATVLSRLNSLATAIKQAHAKR